MTDGNSVAWRRRNTMFEALGGYGQTFGLSAVGDELPVEITNRLGAPR